MRYTVKFYFHGVYARARAVARCDVWRAYGMAWFAWRNAVPTCGGVRQRAAGALFQQHAFSHGKTCAFGGDMRAARVSQHRAPCCWRPHLFLFRAAATPRILLLHNTAHLPAAHAARACAANARALPRHATFAGCVARMTLACMAGIHLLSGSYHSPGSATLRAHFLVITLPLFGVPHCAWHAMRAVGWAGACVCAQPARGGARGAHCAPLLLGQQPSAALRAKRARSGAQHADVRQRAYYGARA